MGDLVVEPKLYFENNVQKGIGLIGSLLQAGVRRFVFSSSCATYGEPEALPIKEDSRKRRTSPYGWSKLLLERLLNSYDLAYRSETCAARNLPKTSLDCQCSPIRLGKAERTIRLRQHLCHTRWHRDS